MIKDIFSLLSFIIKLILKALFYMFKGIAWYFKGIENILKSYPKKGSSKVKVKGEIL